MVLSMALVEKKCRKLTSFAEVLSIPVSTELEVLAKHVIVLGQTVIVLSKFSEEVYALVNDVLADDLVDPILLQHLTSNVVRQVLRFNNKPSEKLSQSEMRILQLTMIETWQT